MGSFIGHAIPGSFFFLFGGWWIVAVLYRYYKCFNKRQVFRSSPTYSTVKTRCGEVDVESLLGVIAALIGIFVEIIAACILRGREIGIGNIQHATMYFFFGFASFSSLFKKLINRHFDEGDKLRYVLLATAMLVEGVLFKFHLYGRDELDILVHTLLLYCVWVSVAVTLGEMVYRDSVLLALGRGIFTVLQGTWFWQVAFILYNPVPGAKTWDNENHHQLMLVVCFFTWHMGFILAAVIGLGVLISCLTKKSSLCANNVVMQDIGNSEQYRSLLNERDDQDTFDD